MWLAWADTCVLTNTQGKTPTVGSTDRTPKPEELNIILLELVHQRVSICLLRISTPIFFAGGGGGLDFT